MVLSANAIKSIAKTMGSIEGNLGVIASQIASDSYKYQDEVAAASTSLKNAMKTCASAKTTLLTKAILTPEHLIEASKDESKLFDKMVAKVISLEARATVLSNILANTYAMDEETEEDAPAVEEEACGDTKAADVTDLPEDGDELTAGEEDEATDPFTDEELEAGDEGELEDEEELDLESDDLTDEELGLGEGEDDVDLQSDEDEEDLDDIEDEEEEAPAPVVASKQIKKPHTGQSRNAMKRQMVKASGATPPVSADLWDFK